MRLEAKQICTRRLHFYTESELTVTNLKEYDFTVTRTAVLKITKKVTPLLNKQAL